MIPRGHGYGWISASFAVAFLLTAVPFPDWAAPWRPSWVAMVLLYWTLMRPQQVGIFSGWCAGLVLDVFVGSLLGIHAAALAFVAFLAISLHQRFRAYHLFQQTLVIGLILLAYLLFVFAVRYAIGQGTTVDYFGSTLPSMVLWPWLYLILRDVQRRIGLL
jgi:rod shape-determining protein MreD